MMMGEPNTHTLAEGTVVDGRFRIKRLLGEGGFGVVFKAEQLSTGQNVAIKVLHTQRIANPSASRMIEDRFVREMQVIARLKHPNIVRLIDTGKLDTGELYAAIEFVEGEPLSDLLAREGQMQAQDAIRVMGQVLDALSCAHDSGIVHRDLKPDNIMVTTTGARRNALVLDFGIAGIAAGEQEDPSKKLTATGQFIGTPYYMAPEQLTGHSTTPQSDIYAWGLVFLEVLTGRTVVGGASIAAIIMEQCSPKPIHIIASIAKSPLGRILARATEKSLEKRYPHASEALTELDAAMTQAYVYNIPLLGSEAMAGGETQDLSENEIGFKTGESAANWKALSNADKSTAPRVVGATDAFERQVKNSRLGLIVGALVLLIVGAGVVLATQMGGGDAIEDGGAKAEATTAPVEATSEPEVTPAKETPAKEIQAKETPTKEVPAEVPLGDVAADAPKTPDDPAEPGLHEQNIDDALLVGLRMQNAGDAAAAKEAFAEVLAVDPNHDEAKEGMAWALLALEDFDSAFLLYDTLSKEPGFEARGLLGAARAKRGAEALPEARDLYKEYLQRFPDDSNVRQAKNELKSMRPGRPVHKGGATNVKPKIKPKGLVVDPNL